MGKVIDKLNRKLQQKQDTRESALVNISNDAPIDIYASYVIAKENNKTMNVCFDIAMENGDLICIDDNNVKVILSEESLFSAATYYRPKIRSKFIGISMSVRVSKIDKDTMTVYVRSARGASSDRKQIVGELHKELDAGNRPVVYGSIRYTSTKRAFVNICGMNVSGMVTVADWSKGYLRYLNEFCKVGMIYPFTVERVVRNRSDQNGSELFILSHKDFTMDPWESLDTSIIEVGGVLFVKCLDCPKGKSYWWGSSKIAPGIEILGNFSGLLTIHPGVTYKCKIRKFDLIQHVFQVSPFEVAEPDVAAYNAQRNNIRKG